MYVKRILYISVKEKVMDKVVKEVLKEVWLRSTPEERKHYDYNFNVFKEKFLDFCFNFSRMHDDLYPAFFKFAGQLGLFYTGEHLRHTLYGMEKNDNKRMCMFVDSLYKTYLLVNDYNYRRAYGKAFDVTALQKAYEINEYFGNILWAYNYAISSSNLGRFMFHNNLRDMIVDFKNKYNCKHFKI